MTEETGGFQTIVQQERAGGTRFVHRRRRDHEVRSCRGPARAMLGQLGQARLLAPTKHLGEATAAALLLSGRAEAGWLRLWWGLGVAEE